jgi:hypothetical protein
VKASVQVSPLVLCLSDSLSITQASVRGQLQAQTSDTYNAACTWLELEVVLQLLLPLGAVLMHNHHKTSDAASTQQKIGQTYFKTSAN